MGQVVIASRLSDGRVVFLRASADAVRPVEWVLELDAAEVAAGDERAAELLALGEADAETHQSVIDVYRIDVEEVDGCLRPTRFRERIRCCGPTVRPDLGKQAVRGGHADVSL
ncbi:MAG TPA: DUF2849 domain-containing protein [Deltaproteobacteria bacterium]|nr:DUF2849 domain-containing protein [Deltaproteobacteria bacterium]